MAKTTIEFEYEGKNYELGYTAETLKRAERNGFNFATIDRRLLSAPVELFKLAFDWKHRNTPDDVREAMFYALSNESEDGEIGAVLGDMLAEAIEDTTTPKGAVMWRKKN